MPVERIDIAHFRNITEASLTLAPHLTLVVGANGQGKTNLLEALYVILQGRDFRVASERDAIQLHESVATLTAEGRLGDHPVRWRHAIQRQPLRRLHSGPVVPVVLFSPEDVTLAKGSPEVRRRFLDLLLAPHDPHYARSLKAYHRVLLQRNRALKEAQYHGLIDDFTPLLIREGTYIWRRRSEAFQELLALAKPLHHELAGGEDLTASYHFGGAAHPVADEETYRAEMQRRRPDEIVRQVTLVGPHRDDLEFFLNGQPAAGFASQGQLRTIALSLKLATYDWLAKETGMTPVVLLDDVLSELDSARRSRLLALVAQPGQQTLVTDTEARNFEALTPLIYHVGNGVITPWER